MVTSLARLFCTERKIVAWAAVIAAQLDNKEILHSNVLVLDIPTTETLRCNTLSPNLAQV